MAYREELSEAVTANQTQENGRRKVYRRNLKKVWQ